jgi:hypothetical protein
LPQHARRCAQQRARELGRCSTRTQRGKKNKNQEREKAKVRKASLAKEAIGTINIGMLPRSSALTVPKEKAREKENFLLKEKENHSTLETEARGMLDSHVGVNQALPLLSHRTRR